MDTQNKQTIIADLRQNTTVTLPYFTQNDTNIIEFVVKDNGTDADLSDVDRITANYKRPDGVVISRLLTVHGNIVTYQIGHQEMEVAGTGELSLHFFDGEQRLSSKRIKVYIASSIEPGIEGTDELTVLQELFFEVDNDLQAINETNTLIQENEEVRQANEASRVDAEALRVSAENTRESNEEARKANEAIRQQQEEARQATIAEAETAITNAEEATLNANTAADNTNQRLTELNGVDATQFHDRVTAVEGKLTESDRQTQVLQSGLNVLNTDVATPVSFEIPGRTLTSMANSNLEALKYYVLADKKTKVIVDGATKAGVSKFQKAQTTTTKETFEGKVSGSTVANPHIFNYFVNASALHPPTVANEINQVNYTNVSKLDGTVSNINSLLTSGYIAQQRFSFNLIEAVERKLGRIPATDKVAWLKENVNKLTANWHGYGSGVGGNKATLTYWKNDASAWDSSNFWTHANGGVSKLTISFVSTLVNAIGNDGMVHLLAYAPASDGTTASTISTDYIDLDVELKATAQLDTRPTLVRVENFEGKVSGSTVENPHDFKAKGASILYTPTQTWDTLAQTHIDRANKLDGALAGSGLATNGSMAQHLFSFDLIAAVERNIGAIPKATVAEKVQWIKDNIRQIACGWNGYGSSAGGSKATLTFFYNDTMQWYPGYVHTNSSVSKIYLPVAASISRAVDNNGFVHFLAYAEPSDGTTASTINTDYVELEIELKPTASFQKPRVPLYEVTQEEYNNILVSWDETAVLNRYPVVEGVQHLQNPAVMAEGENLLPPFTAWDIHANAAVKGPYELTLNATAAYQYSMVKVKAMPNQSYSLNVDTEVNSRLNVVFYDKTGAYITELTVNGAFTTPANTDYMYVRLSNNASKPTGVLTFKNPMLTLGDKAKPFTPRNPSYLFAETKLGAIGSNKDVLYKENGEWKRRKVIEKDVVLDGSLGWVNASNQSGYKMVLIDKALHGFGSGDWYNFTNHIVNKHDGKKMKMFGGYTFDGPDAFYTGGSGGASLRIAVSNQDTGFTDSYTPTNDEWKAYFYGWKVKTADANGKPTAWVSVVDGTDAPTQTLDYVKANKAANYTPYKLSYVLSSPKVERVNVEGDIAADGLTQVELFSGVVVREKVTPQISGAYYYINTDVIPLSFTKNKLAKIIEVYKGTEPDVKNWELLSANTNGLQRVRIPEANFDKTVDYYVTYTVLNKHQFTNAQTETKAVYAKNIRSAHDDLAVLVGDLTTLSSVHVKAIAELYKRVKALGG